MNRALVLGAGNIGSRHLQALAKSKLPLEITVVDPNPKSLEVSRERFDEASKGRKPKKIGYFRNIDDLSREFDIGIVATNADVRRSVIEELLRKSRVKYLIIEKIAFQNSSDFKNVIRLLKKKNTKAWVNLPRRVTPFYNNLKTTIEPGERVYFTVQGGDWSLACNAIHFIDCVCYLINESCYEMNYSGLDKSLKESKRHGFVEFTGSLHCSFKEGSELSLISLAGMQMPALTTIQTKSSVHIIHEERGKGWVSKEENHWQWRKIEFAWPYQSDLTHKIVEEIISTGNCGLPSIEESFLIHKPMLNSFIEYLENLKGKKYTSCPIT